MITEQLVKLFTNVIEEYQVQKVMPSAFKNKILDHLLRLNNEDRRLRFGGSVNEGHIERYVTGLKDSDIIFAIFDVDLNIIGLSHFALANDNTAELAFSVDEAHRGKKYGSKLFHRGILSAKILGIKEIFIQCLSENKAIRALAKAHKLSVVTSYGEAEGRLHIDDVRIIDVVEYAMTEHFSLCDFTIKSKLDSIRQAQNTILRRVNETVWNF